MKVNSLTFSLILDDVGKVIFSLKMNKFLYFIM